MSKYVPTLTDFILHEERKFKNATGSFTILLTQIENAAKIIASHIRASGLVDVLGNTGKKNVFLEEIQKLDELSNDILINTLTASGQVFAMVSEEMEKPIYTLKSHAGDYIVYLDPLDGSSNIDTNIPVGTIFSIYHKNGGLLQEGKKQIAAGYIIYGSSVMFVYTFGNGVNGFTLDPAIGSFLLSHPDIKIPKKGSIYAINEAYSLLYENSIKNYLTFLKNKGSYKSRYVGTLVADIHRTLLKGGIFLYPADKKNKDGKLRLMLEVNPVSYIIEQAGGFTFSRNGSPLAIKPEHIHQKVPFICGSPEDVKEFINHTAPSS